MCEEYETKRVTRFEVKRILESMTIAIDPKLILIQLAAFIKGVSYVFRNQEMEFMERPNDIKVGWAQFEACIFLSNAIMPSIL